MTARNTTLMGAFEDRWRGDHNREHGILLNRSGQQIVERSGDCDSVEFSAIELEAAKSGYLSHTHPRDLGPSNADLQIAAMYGLTLRAVGIAPDTKEHFDHTVRVSMPDIRLADAIAERWDTTVKQAEIELANQSYNDLEWQRESRHLAIQRLARELGFFYQREQHRILLSEATRQEKARLDVLNNVETVMRDRVFSVLHEDIIRNLSRMADNGKVPVHHIEQARQMVGTLVQRTILGPATRDGSLHPYVVQRGEVIPRSLYFKVLWGLMREAGTAAANRQADLMRKYLPADMVRTLEYATVNPFDADLSEMDEAPDLSGHDPLHMWTGPDGKRLMDRLWNVSADMFRRLDLFIASAIARGEPVDQIDKSLGRYLVEDKGSYEAMRLARTETAATFSRVDSAAANLNPIVETYQPFTSPMHRHLDLCDEMVAGGPYPASDTDHLPPYHPFCLCGVIWDIVQDVPAAVAKLRSQIEQAIARAKKAFTDLIGPLSKRFIDVIFGSRS